MIVDTVEVNIMAIKKVRLNYMSVVSKISPIRTIVVSRNSMENLDKSIRQKIRQNEAERAASMEIANRYIVR